MGRAELLTALYTSLTSMTILDGYNYDWNIAKSDDNGNDAAFHPAICVRYGSEENSDDIGAGGTGEYTDIIPVIVTAWGGISLESSLDTVQYECELYRSAMIDDIKRRLGYVPDELSNIGCVIIRYRGQNEVDETKIGAYSVSVELRFDMTYRSARRV